MLAGLVHTPIARALSWALIHFLWEGAAIAALLAAALFVFRPASARVRYGLACVALCAMLAAPGATLGILWPRVHADAGVVIRSGPPPAVHAPAPAPPGPLPALPPDPLAWVAPFWMAGVLIFYLRTAASWVAAERLRRRGTIPAAAGWQDRLCALAGRLRVSRPVAMLESCLAETPAVVGFLRPVILIPAGLLTGLAPEQVEAILLHELAHIRRHDYAVNVLQTLVEGLLFYHPAVWWVSGIIRAERENCCDDAVVEAVGDARGYASALAALERSRSVGQPALAATGGDLKRRIRRLLEPEGPRSIAGPVLGATLLVVSIAAGLMAWQPATPGARPPAPAAAPAPAQSSERAAQEAQLRAQLATPYEKWLSEDVVYIITPEERAAFQRLQTDEEREQFIEQFWLRRDSTPGTVENEFKEEHYRRIAYANEHFAESIPGWKTHRGMYYIQFGPPDEIDDHRDSQPPFMAWTYRAIQPAPGAPAGEATVVFTDVDGSGRFILPKHTPASAVTMGTPPLVGVLNQTAKLLVGVPSFGGPTVVHVRIENQARANVAEAREEASAPCYTKAFQLPPGVYHIQVFVQRPGEAVIALFPRGQQFEIPGPGAARGAAGNAVAAQGAPRPRETSEVLQERLDMARTQYTDKHPQVINLLKAVEAAKRAEEQQEARGAVGNAVTAQGAPQPRKTSEVLQERLDMARSQYTEQHPQVQNLLKAVEATRRAEEQQEARENSAKAAVAAAPSFNDDRGLVYGVLGPPDEIATEGDGQSWIYRHVEGAGDQVAFRLTNIGGSGRFVLAAAPTAGANANQSGLMDLATRVKAYGAQLDNLSSSPLDVKVAIKTLEVRPPDPAGASQTSVVISVQAPGAGGKLKIYGRVTTMTRRLVNVFEETVSFAPGQAWLYERTIPLIAGRYRLDIIVKDLASGRIGDKEMEIEGQP